MNTLNGTGVNQLEQMVSHYHIKTGGVNLKKVNRMQSSEVNLAAKARQAVEVDISDVARALNQKYLNGTK